ncbi:hypothetical protein ANCCAN_09904 [Ancylostoma caninum]|uniref:Uncharacterized protein n=1 Tax=Ancylostoma caninum TaxID=29170 RepID=A0A368GM62_ANCCA|nr:hypothetical protein ANCCAN_09904 [Ancylostoma caninum]
MSLPSHPPTPLIQISSPVPSDVALASPLITSHPVVSPPSLNEFDPTALREQILRDAILGYGTGLGWEYSIICGGEQRRGEEKQSSVSICIDVPAPVATSILGTVDADYPEDPIGFSFSFISFTTALVFLLMTYVYVNGFVYGS